MTVMSVSGLEKRFSVRYKRAGLRGSVRALLRPERGSVTAVDGVSFELERGGLLALIGPNGAGKSTTIKMLTGILHPSGGSATVLGLTPWRDRARLAYSIGTVFGQRPQLWYHLPPIDSFHLLARIYDVPADTARRRVAELAEVFAIGDLLEVPVRKLSLGQRMRCEVAASLVHRPELLLLDEPSIGLDVVAKHRIRDMVRHMNRDEGVTVLLTSHDAGDVEALCRDVVVIDHGRIVHRDTVAGLRRLLGHRVLTVRWAEAAPADVHIPGAEVLRADDYELELRVDVGRCSVKAVLERLLAAGEVADVSVGEPPLEEVIRHLFTTARRPPAEEPA